MKKNKNLLLGGTLAAALILSACGANSSASADDMEWETEEKNGTVTVRGNEETASGTTAQEAVDKALKEFDGAVTDVEYDEDDGVYYYDIEIENGSEDFDVKLNAEDLSIIEQDLDRDDDRDDDRDEEDDQEAVQKNDSGESADSIGDTTLTDAFKEDKSAEAIEAAKENFDGILESVSYEEEDGVYYYEVKLENETEEYEVKLDAEDLSVLEEEREDGNSQRGFKKLEAAHEEEIISFEKAQQLAKENVKGELQDWEYDADDFKYEFEIGGTDIKIDAKSGRVTELDD